MTESEWLTSTDPQAMLTLVTNQPLASDRKLRLFAVACCRQAKDGVPCPRCSGRKFCQACSGEGCSGNVGYLDDPKARCNGNGKCSNCYGTGRIAGLTDPRSRNAVEVAERYADGLATKEELATAGATAGAAVWAAAMAAWWSAVRSASWSAVRSAAGSAAWSAAGSAAGADQAALLRCLFGNPWRPVSRDMVFGSFAGSGWSGLEGLARVIEIARAIYDERCWSDLPILADALEEAGCPPAKGCIHCAGGDYINLDPPCGCSTTELLLHLRGPGPHARGCWAVDLILGKE